MFASEPENPEADPYLRVREIADDPALAETVRWCAMRIVAARDERGFQLDVAALVNAADAFHAGKATAHAVVLTAIEMLAGLPAPFDRQPPGPVAADELRAAMLGRSR